MKMKGILKRLATLTIMAALVLCLLPHMATEAHAAEPITLSDDTFTPSPGEGFAFRAYFFCYGCDKRVYIDSDIESHSFNITSFTYKIANGTAEWNLTANFQGCRGSGTGTNSKTCNYICTEELSNYYGVAFDSDSNNQEYAGLIAVEIRREKTAHQGDATCVTSANCTLCGTSYKTDHVYDTNPTGNGLKHYHPCTTPGCTEIYEEKTYSAIENGIQETCNFTSCDRALTITLPEITESCTYTGAGIRPLGNEDVVYSIGGNTIAFDTIPADDIVSVQYANNVNAGTARAYIEKGGVSAERTFTINKATPTAEHFTFTPPGNLTYDGGPKSATVSLCTPYTGCSFSAIYYTQSGAMIDRFPVSAGTYTAKIKVYDDSKNFNELEEQISNDAWTFTIAPKDMSDANITFSPLTYDGTEQRPTVTVDGLTEGTDYTVTWNESSVDAGTYTATITPTTTNTNYTGSTTATYTIGPKPVSVSGITAKDKVYDGTNTATLDCTNATFDGIVGGDILGVTATGSFIDPNVREDKTVNISDLVLTGEDKANYTLDGRTQQETTTAKVTPKPITATITVPEGNTYGNVKEPEVEFIGVAPNDTVDVTWTYKGKTNHEENNDYGPTTTMPTEAGTYTVSASISNPNYFLTGNTTAQFNIAKAVTVKTAPVAIPNLVYDGSEQALITAGEVSDAAKTAGYKMTYMLTEEDAGYTNTVPTATDAGTYEITWFAGYDTPNFIMSRGTFEVTIAKADIDYTAPTAETLTYNTKQQYLVSGGDSRLQYKLDNGEWSDTIPYATNAGDYTVYYRTNMGDNYNNVPETPIPVKIAPFNLATAGGKPIGLVENFFVYDGTAKTGNISAKVEFQNTEPQHPIIEVTLTKGTDFTLTYENNVKVGTATATFTGKGNYTGVVTDTFEITKAPLTLTVHDQTITYGEEIDQSKYSVTGLATGDTAAVTLTPSTDQITNSGTITAEITVKNAAGEDVTECYTIADSAGNLVINAKPLTETAVSGIAQTYDHTGGDLTPAIVVKDGNKTLVKGTDYDVTFTDKDGKTVEKPTDHGEYKATITFKGNYSGSAEKTFKIVAPTYAITKGNGGKYTDGSTKNLSFTANGLFSKFTGLEVNGKTLDTKYYTAKSGSTVVTLKASYLDTLSPGKYALTFLYTDGKVSGDFTVQAKTNVPATRDSSDLLLWVALLFAGMAAMITFVFGRKRKKS